MFVQMMMTILNPTAGRPIACSTRQPISPGSIPGATIWSRGASASPQPRSSDPLRPGANHRRCSPQRKRRTVVCGDYYVAALPLERIAPLVNEQMLRRSGARQSEGAGAERRVDERHAVLSAARRADRSWPRDSHRYRMGADQHLPGAVLGQPVVSEFGDTRSAACCRSTSPTGRIRDRTDTRRCSALARRSCASLGTAQAFRQRRTELLRDEDLHSWFLDPDIQQSRVRDFCTMPSRCW